MVIFPVELQSYMKKLFFGALLILALLQSANAQVVLDYEIGLDRILPGDTVDCYLLITNPNPNPETIRSVVFYSDLVNPRIVTDIGTLAGESVYRLPFTFSAEKPGRYVVEVKVRTYNGSLTYYIPFTVTNAYPVLRIENPEVVIGERNVLKISVDWNGNVTIRPLFNATPSESFGKSFEFVYYPEKREKLAFEVEFRNGENLHRVVREVNVTWSEVRDVAVNVTYNRNAYENEALRVFIGVANLRTTPIYDVSVRLGGVEKSVPVLNPGEEVRFEFSVMASRTLGITLTYLDERGVRHEISERKELEIINESAVQLCSYEFDGGVLTGDVCNFGSTEVKNVVVSFGGKRYFIGSVMPEDYEVFSIKTNRSNGTLVIEWKNVAGAVLSTSALIEGEKVEVKVKEGGSEIIAVSVVIAAAIVVLAVYAMRRR